MGEIAENLKQEYSRLAPTELLAHLVAAVEALKVPRVETAENREPAFQVIATEALTPEGKITSRVEMLREGEIIEQEGRCYRVVKNDLGTLYKKSIQALGQVGHAEPVSVAQFQEQLLQQIQNAFPKGDAGGGFLGVFREAKALPTFSGIKGLQPQEIQPLFENLFTETARQAIKHVKLTGPFTEMIDGQEQAVLPMYASVRIKNQEDRQYEIARLITAINAEAEIGAIRGVQAPLSSVVVPVQKHTGGNFIERLAAPIERFDEIVFIFPWVLVSFMERIKASHEVFRKEDELPPE